MHARRSNRAVRRRASRMLCVTAIAALAIPGSAWADQLANSLDDSRDAALETLSLTVPTAGSTSIYVHPVKDEEDGEPGCNVQGTEESVTFSVTSSDTSHATVSPSSISFDNCGNPKPVTVTPVSEGSATITFARIASTGAVGGYDVAPATFVVDVSPAPVGVQNGPPTITGDIAGATAVDEGANRTYGVAAGDPDGDPLTYAWTVTGNATINGSGAASDVVLDFTDGPSDVVLSVAVSDDHGHTTSRSLPIAESNVAPTVHVSGPLSADEGDSKTYGYTVSDPGSDPDPTVTESCGAHGTLADTADAGGFGCTFPDGPASSAVTVTADDRDPSNNVGADGIDVAVANVAPSIVDWRIALSNAVACLGGNTVGVSFGVSDPADQSYDAIGGSAFTTFTGRSVSQSHVFGPGVWSVTANVDDGDGGADTRTGGGAFLYSAAGGFPLPPVNADGTSNFKLGSTIPVKLRIVDCVGKPVSGLAPQVSLVRTASGDGAVNESVDVVSVPDDGKTMRYDATAGQYIYNLSTKRSVFGAPAGGPLGLGRYTLSVGGSLIAAPPAVGFDILK